MPATSTRALAVVSELAAGQWGLLTTAQAGTAGVTRVQLARLTDADVLERVDQGVYATTASPTEHRALRAAWLALDPAHTAEERLADPVNAGVASHASAAGLHRLGDLLDDTPELTVPHRKQSRRGVRLHRLPLTDDDITLVDGLPTTTEERTVADLLRDGHDPDHVAQIIGQGLRRAVIDLGVLAAHLDPLARRYGQPDGRALVEHLLDLVGLSPAALARELAASTAGQELVAAGRAQAIGELVASLMPQINAAEILGMNKIAANLAAGMDASKLIDLSRAVEPLQAELANTLLASQLRSTFNPAQTAAFREAVAAALFPSVKAAQQRLLSDIGRSATAAAADAQRDHPQATR